MKERWVRVEWDDASFNSAEVTRRDVRSRPLVRCVTVGHLIVSDKRSVIVAQEIYPAQHEDESETLRRTTTIPRGMVRKVTYLKEAK